MPFTWVLHCQHCDAHFSPTEEDWDGPITCPTCGAIDIVDHDNYGKAIEPQPLWKAVPPLPKEPS